MQKKNNDDSQLEKHKNSASQKKFDTLDFYKENLPLNAVEKLYNSSQEPNKIPVDISLENNRLFNKNSSVESINLDSDTLLSSYIDFINKYKKDNKINDSSEANILKPGSNNNKKHEKKTKTKLNKKRTRSQEEEEFLNNFTSRTGSFNYDYYKHKNPVIKVLTSISFIVFLGAIAFLCYKINLLNTKLINAQSRLEKNIDTKKELEFVLAENETLKKTIQSLNIGIDDKQQNNSNSSQYISKASDNISINNNNNNNNLAQEKKSKEYIVQPGDTLSSISKKFYGSSNLYQKIMNENNLTSDNLSESQKLIIPD